MVLPAAACDAWAGPDVVAEAARDADAARLDATEAADLSADEADATGTVALPPAGAETPGTTGTTVGTGATPLGVTMGVTTVSLLVAVVL
jgi:hypothetical protein